jgi:nucleotide-binding universal stress UspA family protein
MAIRNLLVAFNETGASQSAVNAAVAMHRKYGAHLTGLLAHEGHRDHFNKQPWVPENVRAALEAATREREKEVEKRFRDTVGDDVPDEKLHWITLPGDPDRRVAQYASMFDITLVGQQAHEDQAATALHPERIALKSGRPVLIVPVELPDDLTERRAVVAWDGQRAATRALSDAMQILETKQKVDVISIGDEVHPPLPGIDVVSALERHGVDAERIRLDASGRGAGEDILAYCRDVDAGLVVMGAFEHSVFREELFGGTTKFVLENAKLPVLVSH